MKVTGSSPVLRNSHNFCKNSLTTFQIFSKRPVEPLTSNRILEARCCGFKSYIPHQRGISSIGRARIEITGVLIMFLLFNSIRKGASIKLLAPFSIFTVNKRKGE